MKSTLFIATRYIKKRRGFLSAISFITIGAIAVGVSVVIIVLSVINGFHHELKEKILGMNPHIIVTKFYYTPFLKSERIESVIKSVKDVEEITPFIMNRVYIQSQKEGTGILLKGIDFELEKKMLKLPQYIVQGNYSLSKDEVLLGVYLARELNVSIGDLVSIATVNPKQILMTPKVKLLRVSGIFDAGMFDYNASIAFVSLETAQEIFQTKGITGYEVKVKNVYKANKIASEIWDKLQYPYRALDWITMNKNLFTALAMEKVVALIILILLIIVASFNIVGMLIMMVIKKTKEIGILRAIGMTAKKIMELFILTGFLLGVIGTFLGVIIGFTVSKLLDKLEIINLPGETFFITTVPVITQWSDFFFVVTASLFISFLATIYPANKASKMSAVQAIRYE